MRPDRTTPTCLNGWYVLLVWLAISGALAIVFLIYTCAKGHWVWATTHLRAEAELRSPGILIKEFSTTTRDLFEGVEGVEGVEVSPFLAIQGGQRGQRGQGDVKVEPS